MNLPEIHQLSYSPTSFTTFSLHWDLRWVMSEWIVLTIVTFDEAFHIKWVLLTPRCFTSKTQEWSVYANHLLVYIGLMQLNDVRTAPVSFGFPIQCIDDAHTLLIISRFQYEGAIGHFILNKMIGWIVGWWRCHTHVFTVGAQNLVKMSTLYLFVSTQVVLCKQDQT